MSRRRDKDKGEEDVPWVLFDLDGTLANINHRLAEIKAGNYHDSMMKIPEDVLKTDIYYLWEMAIDAGYNIAMVTGREDMFQLLTEQWLEKHGIYYDELHMRKSKDYRSDFEVKQEILDTKFGERDILFVVDDRQSVVDMWRRNNITCLQCQGGDY